MAWRACCVGVVRRFPHLHTDPRCGSRVNLEAKVGWSFFPRQPRQKALIGLEEQTGGSESLRLVSCRAVREASRMD